LQADKRARFIHLTNAGVKMTGALLRAREQVIAACVSPLSPADLNKLGRLSERLLVANGYEKSGVASMWPVVGYSRETPPENASQPARKLRRRRSKKS
jgi:hypothetical protein